MLTLSKHYYTDDMIIITCPQNMPNTSKDSTYAQRLFNSYLVCGRTRKGILPVDPLQPKGESLMLPEAISSNFPAPTHVHVTKGATLRAYVKELENHDY